MEPLPQIAPLVALIAISGGLVFRGMRTEPDRTDNKARGGGSWSHYEG